MKFKRLFYDSEIEFRNISKQSLFVAIVIGIVSAFVIYSWFYVVREVYRLISISFDYIPSILSESERNYHNLFFAFLSLIFGNSITLSLIFSEPQNLIGRRNPKRMGLINNQVFLNFNFAYWFVKIGLAFGLFSMYMDYFFNPYFKLFLLLLLLVLYLETWKTLFQILGKKKWKYLIIHLLIFSLIGFLLSRVDVVNYKKLDACTLKNNPIINLPFSDYSYDDYDWRNRTIIIKVKVDDDEISLFSEKREKFGLNQLTLHVLNEKKSFRAELQDRVCIKIYADADIDILHIKRIEKELFKINISCIVYGVSNGDPLTKRFENRGIKSQISTSVTKLKYKNDTLKQPPPIPEKSFYLQECNFKDTLRIDIGDSIKINDTVVQVESLSDKLKKHINVDTVFEYKYDSSIEYQQYINVLSAHKKAIYQLIKSHYPKDKDVYSVYSRVDMDELREYRKKYPLNITEKIN